jgi:hypothetical protein
MAQLEARVLWGCESLVGRTKTLSPPSKRLSYDINIILNNRLPKSQAKSGWGKKFLVLSWN